MLCSRCKKEVEKEKPKVLISRKQYEKLQAGSVLLSVGGRRRVVVYKNDNGYIRLRKLSWKGQHCGDYTGYLYSDISRRYKIIKY